MKEKKVKIKYELRMWQLLGIFVVAIFVAIGIGAWIGNSLGYQVGYSAGVDAVEVSVPAYCSVVGGREQLSVECAELENVTLADFCKYLSPALEQKVKLLVVTGS